MDEEVEGDGSDLLPIGVFARAVGVTASALRFYDDSGLLRPAFVDPATGYRWYAPAQELRVVLLRRLRTAGVPLAETVAVLDGNPEVARRVLSAYLAAAEARWEVARRTLGELLAALPDPELSPGAAARLEARELQAAVTQVTPAVGADDVDPVLRCVLVEVDAGEVRLVATDRYRLAVRVLKAADTRGTAAALQNPGSLAEAAGWAAGAGAGTVELKVSAGELKLTTVRGRRVLPAAVGTYPDYRQILTGVAAPTTRCTVGRTGLLDFLQNVTGPVVLNASGDRLTVAGLGPGDPTGDPGAAVLPALVCGPEVRVVFALEVLLPAVTASVGPDVLLEIAAPDRAVVVRSADEGAFTTLAMPTRLPPDYATTTR